MQADTTPPKLARRTGLVPVFVLLPRVTIINLQPLSGLAVVGLAFPGQNPTPFCLRGLIGRCGFVKQGLQLQVLITAYGLSDNSLRCLPGWDPEPV